MIRGNEKSMQIVTPVDKSAQLNAELRMGYLWMIASVAALGGLLFGYDWVVIGGARPFYEAYFHLKLPHRSAGPTVAPC